MRVYAIMIKVENDNEILFRDEIVGLLKEHDARIVMDGYDWSRYVACFICKTEKERDELAWGLVRLGIVFDKRDDGEIEDRYAEGWK